MCWLRRVMWLALVPAATAAQDVTRLYTTPQLEQAATRAVPWLRGVWEENLLSELTRDERVKAGLVTLTTPLVGRTRQPFEFYSSPDSRQVFIPVASIKFLDDLTIASAYYAKGGCDEGVISDYAALLRFHPLKVEGSPLDSLGVPPDACKKDPWVDNVSQGFLKVIVYFVLVHEYAHVMYRHKGYDVLTAAQAQGQEAEADAFALEMMRRIGLPPGGLTVFFAVASRLEQTPGDFSTPLMYERYLRQQATHPVSAMRIVKLAEGMEAHSDEFARLQADPRAYKGLLQGETSKMRQIAGSSTTGRCANSSRGKRIASTALGFNAHVGDRLTRPEASASPGPELEFRFERRDGSGALP